jgi:hypothetical protein
MSLSGQPVRAVARFASSALASAAYPTDAKVSGWRSAL